MIWVARMTAEPLSRDEQFDVAYRMAEGERDALVRLLEAYGPKVKWLLQRKFGDVLSEDDVSVALFLAGQKAFENASQFDDRKSTLGGWFYIIARNCAVDLLREEKPDPAFQLDIEPADPETGEDDDDRIDPNDPVIKDLLACVDDLGDKQRIIIKADLLANGEADATKLADKLGIPKQHVYSYRNKAHEALLKRMATHGHTAETIRRRR